MSRSLKVMKFGGTSLADSARIRTVARIVDEAAATHDVIVVVSAMAGVTNRLERLSRLTSTLTAGAELEDLFEEHRRVSTTLHNPVEKRAYKRHADALRLQVLKRLDADPTSGARGDEFLAAGERLSAPLLAGTLRSAVRSVDSWDAADLIRTDSTFGEATVDWVYSYETIRRWHAGQRGIAVVTGFIGSDANGRTTTLGRGGSDYTAAIIASALEASVLERWTDVDGVYTSDPAVDQGATRIDRMPVDRARDLNRAGRIGMHREALEPVFDKGIPVNVRSTLKPEHPGTWIDPVDDRSQLR